MKNVLSVMVFPLSTAAVAGALVFAPGNGVTTNVTERMYGEYDSVEINAGTSGGGIVDFSNPWSLYQGAATVNCGTFSLSGELRPVGQPSVLGRGAVGEVITVKDGTFHYAGPAAETDRGLCFAPSGTNKAAVVSVAAGTSLKLTGPVTSENGVIVKRGEGTLVLAPATADPTNVFCHANVRGSGALSFPANGDSPTGGYGDLTVQEGRLVLDFPENSVNLFHGGNVSSGAQAVYIGRTPEGETTAKEAHLEIRGGDNYASRTVYVGYKAGTATTTESVLHHSIDVYGGLFDNYHQEGCTIYVGVSDGAANRSVGEVNVYGGKLRTFYYRPGCYLGSVSRTFIANGSLECYGVYAGQYSIGTGVYLTDWNDPDADLIPEVEVHVSTNGYLNLQGGPYYMGRDSLVRNTLKITDGGRMKFKGFVVSGIDATREAMQQNARMTVLLDGGTMDVSGQNSPDMASPRGVTTKLGARGGCMYANGSKAVYTFWGPIVKAEGVAQDGGIELTGVCIYRIFGENSFSGDVHVNDACTLVVSNSLTAAGVRLETPGRLASATATVSLPALVCPGMTATLCVTNFGGAATRFALGAFTPPASLLYFKLEGSYSTGDYELLTYPATVEFDAGRAVVEGGNLANGKEYSFRTVTAGDTTKLVMTVKAVSTPSAAAASWTNANGGDWSVAGNWSGTAPSAAAPAAVTFAAVPSADPVTVSLDDEQQLTALSFPASPGYRVAGSGTIRLDNGGSPATVAAAGGATNQVAVPVVASGKVALDIPQYSHLELASLSGTAQLTTTTAADGYGGMVKIGDASGFKGSISFQRGLLELGTMPGVLTALDIGFGEFRYAGSAVEHLTCPVNFIATKFSNSKVCVADPAGELHVDGQFIIDHGSFSKTGKGLLAFDGALDYAFAMDAASYGQFDHNVKMTDAVGTPAWGFMRESSARDRSQCTTFAGGTVRWGVPGQSVSFGKVGDGGLYVGSVSTAEPGRELDAFAEINGGETAINGYTYVGFRHGYPATAEHSTLTSRVTMTAGTLSGNGKLYVLHDDKKVCSARAEWLQRGGDAEFTYDISAGCAGTASCSALLEVSGGRLASTGGSLLLGEKDGNAATTTVRLTGGVLDVCWASMRYGVNRLEVLEGGTLRSASLTALASGDNRVLFDGGVFKANNPTGGCSIDESNSKLDELAVGAKGMIVDLTDMPTHGCALTKALTTAAGVAEDGGVIVRRTGGYRPGALAFQAAQQTGFSGKVVVESGAAARGGANPCVTSNFIVTVKNGASFGAQWTSEAGKYCCVKSLALGESSGDVAILQVQTGMPTYSGTYSGTVWATDSFSAPGLVDVTITDNDQTTFVAPTYAMMVLIAPKGTIDASKFRYSSLNPPATANFTVSSFDANYDKLSVTLSAATATEHVWTAAGGGAWGDAANWSSAPADSIYDAVVFPVGFAGGTIALGGDHTLMRVSNAGEGEVTLAGGTLELGASPAISTASNGVLRLPAIVSASEVSVNAIAPAGKVVLAESKGATVIASAGGTVEGSPASFGTGDVKIDNSTISVVGDGMVNARVIGKHGLNLRTEGEVFFMKDVSAGDSSPFMKTGPGTAYLCGSGAVTLGNAKRDTNYDDGSMATTHVPSNGDMPADSLGGATTVTSGKLVLGVDGSQSISTSGRFDVGTCYYELDENGEVLPAEVEMLDGTLAAGGDLNIGRNPGRYAKENSALVGKRRDLAFTIRGGSASFNSFYMLHDNSGKYQGNTHLNVHGGELKFKSTYINLGYTYRAGCTNFVNVSGGKVEFTSNNPNWKNGILGYTVVVNLTGGEFKTCYPLSSQVNKANQYLVYNLAGGRLNVPWLRRVSTLGTENLFWDGGVYAPTTNGCSIACQQLWTRHECRRGGAKIDLSGVVPNNPGDPITFSMNQALAHAEELGAEEDGGIELLGGGTLTLDAANTMNGPVVVSGGTVKPTVAAAVNGGVVVNAGGVFDVNGLAITASYLKGAGGTVAGPLAVAGEIAPATFVTVSNLACGPVAVLKCPLAEVDNAFATTLLKVAAGGAVTKEGKLMVDFCLGEDDVLPKNFAVKIAELGAGATFPATLGVVKTGHEPKHYQLDAKLRPGEGCTEVWAELRGPATVIYFR